MQRHDNREKEYKSDNPTVSLSHIIQFQFIPILIFLESNYFNVSCNPHSFYLNLEVEERIGNHNISLSKSHLSSGFCQDWKGFWRKRVPKLLVVELYGYLCSYRGSLPFCSLAAILFRPFKMRSNPVILVAEIHPLTHF